MHRSGAAWKERGVTAFDYTARGNCACGRILDAGHDRVEKVYLWGRVTFLRCAGCGSWCQSPLIASASLARWFDSDEYQGSMRRAGIAYTNYLGDERNRMIEARGRCSRDLDPLLRRRARILEVGCGTGSLLAALRERGHEVVGLDLSSRFCDFARRTYGVEVIEADLLDVALLPASFDAVVAMGTVSNLGDFAACLSRIRELLRPGGVFIFNYPDADSILVKLVYRHRFWMFTPSIGTFMTTRGCTAAVTRAGFSDMVVWHDIQRPRVQKLLKHARVGFLMAAAHALGLGSASMPFSFRVPTIRFAVARA